MKLCTWKRVCISETLGFVLLWMGGAIAGVDEDPCPDAEVTTAALANGVAVSTEEARASSAESHDPSQLWVEVAAISNGVIYLVLHGTEPLVPYVIESQEVLGEIWTQETNTTGALGLASTALQVPMGHRVHALFLRARSQWEVMLDGVPLEALQLWLRADAGVVRDETNSRVSLWRDQSGQGHDAFQGSGTFQPTWVEDGLNNRPVLRFNPNNFLALPDFLRGNTAAEVVVLLRAATNQPAGSRGLWRMGTAATASLYPHSGGYIADAFGRSAYVNQGVPEQSLDAFHLYGVSASAAEWSTRINGRTHHVMSGSPMSFPSNPNLGYAASSAYFEGDMAEVMLFDRILTADERDAVGRYLNGTYHWLAHAPEVPVGVTATVLAPHQVSVSWSCSSASGTTVFIVERRIGDEEAFAEVARVRDATTWLDPGVSAGDVCSYRVKAWTYAGESAWSPIVTVTTPTDGVELPMEAIQLWLRADSGVVRKGTAGRVGLWLDQSGRGNHASQETVDQQPTLVEGVANGRPAVRFHPLTYQRMRLPDFVSSNAQGNVFAVVKVATNRPAASRGLWRLGDATVAGYYPSTSGSIYESFGGAGFVNTGVPTHRIDQFHLYEVAASSVSWTSRINGQVHHTAPPVTPKFPAVPWLGASGSAGTPTFDGEIAEVILFDRVLTPGERATVGFYLNSKYQFVELEGGPIQLSAQVVSSSQIGLSWSHQGSTNDASFTYTVERCLGTHGAFVPIALVDGDTHYFDEGLPPDSTYGYRIKHTLISDAAPSNETLATTLPAGDPVPFTDLRLWLRADDLEGVDGAAVAEWADFRQPNLKASQADPLWQPTWSAGNFNQHPSITFADGQYLQLPAVCSNATAAEVFAVLKSATHRPAANQGLWRFSEGGATWFPDTNGWVRDAFGSTSAHWSLAPLPDLAAPLIYNVAAGPGLWQSRMNGPLKQSLGSNSFACSGVPVVGRSSGGAAEPFAGSLAEILLFDRVLTPAERRSVRDGLALKYGIALEWPAIPANLAMLRTNPNERWMTWTALTGSESGLECSFAVERQADRNGLFLPIGRLPRTASEFLDASAMPEARHTYRLRVSNEVGEVVSPELAADLPDTDRDGVSDVLEQMLGTSASEPDTDGDGLPDGWEVAHGLNPRSADGRHGAAGDFDRDGLSNAEEHARGTNPADGAAGDNALSRLQVHRPN